MDRADQSLSIGVNLSCTACIKVNLLLWLHQFSRLCQGFTILLEQAVRSRIEYYSASKTPSVLTCFLSSLHWKSFDATPGLSWLEFVPLNPLMTPLWFTSVGYWGFKLKGLIRPLCHRRNPSMHHLATTTGGTEKSCLQIQYCKHLENKRRITQYLVQSFGHLWPAFLPAASTVTTRNPATGPIIELYTADRILIQMFG